MKILLIAAGAREHTIGEALARSPSKPEIITICKSRNPGLVKISSKFFVEDIMNFDKVNEIAQQEFPTLCVIGSDDPIGAGLADELEKMGIPSVAPKKSLARVESSKGFARQLMKKHGINYFPKFEVFTAEHAKDRKALTYQLNTFFDQLGGNYVVKYDALLGGKGVKLSGEHLATVEEGIHYALECIEECGKVVIEEKLIGVEFSYLSFVSGTQVVDMPAVQDHKRAFNGDTGPNTGGMGTYSDADHSLPFLTEQDIQKASEINKLMAQALMKECGEPYKGILYGGFIAVTNGIRVIEYNARFGDPEVLNLLSILESDFVKICEGIVEGKLTDALVKFAHKATVCKYITPESYPDAKTERGQPFTIPSSVPENVKLYFGDVSQADDGSMTLGGSRSLGIVGIGETLAEAEKSAQSFCEQVNGPVRFRSDVGTEELIGKRREMMRGLRNN